MKAKEVFNSYFTMIILKYIPRFYAFYALLLNCIELFHVSERACR